MRSIEMFDYEDKDRSSRPSRNVSMSISPFDDKSQTALTMPVSRAVSNLPDPQTLKSLKVFDDDELYKLHDNRIRNDTQSDFETKSQQVR